MNVAIALSCSFVVLACDPRVEERPPVAAPAAAHPPATTGGLDRAAILARDPKGLPRAVPDAWRGFQIAKLADETALRRIAAARERILDGDLVAALGELHALLVERPDFPPALHMSGIAYFRLQRYGDSAEMLARYLEVAPDGVGDTRVLGHDLYTLGRYAEALAHYERVLERAPGDAEAWRGAALASWRLGETRDALTRIDRALALEPRNDEFHSWKAAILFDAGDLEPARAEAEAGIALDPFEPRTWFTLARVLDELGQAEGARSARARFEALARTAAAVRHAESAWTLAPDRPDLRAAWLDALVAHGAPGPVRAALEKTARHTARHTVPTVLRAELDACLLLGDAQRGGAVARALEAAAGDDARAWRSLRDWYADRGDARGLARAGSHLERLSPRER